MTVSRSQGHSPARRAAFFAAIYPPEGKCRIAASQGECADYLWLRRNPAKERLRAGILGEVAGLLAQEGAIKTARRIRPPACVVVLARLEPQSGMVSRSFFETTWDCRRAIAEAEMLEAERLDGVEAQPWSAREVCGPLVYADIYYGPGALVDADRQRRGGRDAR